MKGGNWTGLRRRAAWKGDPVRKEFIVEKDGEEPMMATDGTTRAHAAAVRRDGVDVQPRDCWQWTLLHDSSRVGGAPTSRGPRGGQVGLWKEKKLCWSCCTRSLGSLEARGVPELLPADSTWPG